MQRKKISPLASIISLFGNINKKGSKMAPFLKGSATIAIPSLTVATDVLRDKLDAEGTRDQIEAMSDDDEYLREQVQAAIKKNQKARVQSDWDALAQMMAASEGNYSSLSSARFNRNYLNSLEEEDEAIDELEKRERHVYEMQERAREKARKRAGTNALGTGLGTMLQLLSGGLAGGVKPGILAATSGLGGLLSGILSKNVQDKAFSGKSFNKKPIGNPDRKKVILEIKKRLRAGR